VWIAADIHAIPVGVVALAKGVVVGHGIAP
jgi:hypothetical protein